MFFHSWLLSLDNPTVLFYFALLVIVYRKHGSKWVDIFCGSGHTAICSLWNRGWKFLCLHLVVQVEILLCCLIGSSGPSGCLYLLGFLPFPRCLGSGVLLELFFFFLRFTKGTANKLFCQRFLLSFCLSVPPYLVVNSQVLRLISIVRRRLWSSCEKYRVCLCRSINT